MHALQVEYTPRASTSTPIGTPPSLMRGTGWQPSIVRSKAVVELNRELVLKVDAALQRGSAEFLVVAEVPKRGNERADAWCELQISRQGARLRCVEGPMSFLGLNGVRRIAFDNPASSGTQVASVAMPASLIQATLRDNDGEVTVQADSAYMRDAIVCAVRRFSEGQ